MAETWQQWLKDTTGKEIEKSLHYMSEEDWVPKPCDRNAAWTLYTELRTRVIHEPLHYRSGDETAALQSLYDLFQITRSILKKHGRQSGHFAVIASALLNRVIRPFTSKWHRLKLKGQLERQDQRRLFRRELQGLQENISYFEKVLGALSDCGSYTRDPGPVQASSCTSKFDANRVWPSEFLGPKETVNDRVSLNLVLEKELVCIAKRREKLYGFYDEKKLGGLGNARNSADSMGLFGLAISGGGIRSATFALGVLQKLAEKKILRDVDYLSTVSGGGYVGAFLSSRMIEENHISKLLVSERDVVETEEVRWLRNRSKYLQGAGLLRSFIGILFRLVVLSLPAIILPALAVFAASLPGVPHGGLAVGVAFVWAVWYLMFCIDINRLTLGLHYRNRLTEAYIKQHGERDSPKLSDLSEAKTAPYHLICAAVNLPSSKNVELRGRRSDFFLFSPLFCGSILTGYRDTKELQECDPHIDLASAMAISGAAVSTHMGTLQQWWKFRPILLLLRLGYWMPNPRFIGTKPKWRGPKARHLITEFLGRFDERKHYVNLSDGGHIENLGIYELLRRRCKFIVCIDGEQDPTQACPALVKACRFAAIDMGVNIDIDLSELKTASDGFSQAHFAIGKINYGRRDSGTEEIGYLLYLKLSMTGNERDYIREYRTRHPEFPHESTLKQLFDEDQFEAYRALGNHVADDLFKEELVGKLDAEKFKTRQWLESLVNALDP